MKRPTVIQALRERPIEEAQHLDVLNAELAPIVRDIRRSVNAQPKFATEYISTQSGTDESAWESEDMPDDGAWHVRAVVCGMSTDGSGKTASYELSALVQSLATVVAPVSTMVKTGWETDAGLDANLAYDATERTVLVTVNDGALAEMQWRVIVNITEVVL